MIGKKGFQKGHPVWNKGLTRETDERLMFDSLRKSGEKNPFFGKHHKPETVAIIKMKITGRKQGKEEREKRAESLLGHDVSQETRKKIALTKIGKPRSDELRKRLSVANKGKLGELSSNWKGGITPLGKRIRNSDKYIKWRDDIFKRDNYICFLCGKRGGHLAAHHHPKTFSSILSEHRIRTIEQALLCDELWDTRNGNVLCDNCHYDLHRGAKKGSNIKSVEIIGGYHGRIVLDSVSLRTGVEW